MEICDIFNSFRKCISDPNELQSFSSAAALGFTEYFKCCIEDCTVATPYSEKKMLHIESILDYLHDELNTGHWSDVPLQIRRAFTVSSFVKSTMLLKSSNEYSISVLQECLKSLDMGLLLGAPLEKNYKLLTECASLLSTRIDELEGRYALPINIKRKLNHDSFTKYREIKAKEIESISCPSMETFNRTYLIPQAPLKLCDCISHWPAIEKWRDINYLIKLAGDRTVPIEIGSNYTNEDWGQKLMSLKEFIKKHFLGEADCSLGYLAQHNLFDQITELRRDISIPEYCCLSESDCEPDINAWFGPEGTISPLHYDPKNNILAQVFGTKQLILFSPNDAPYLYPHEENLLLNTARVDPLQPDMELFKEFTNATMYKCLLEPGEMVYIPKKWWHHVTALDKSFSVSFWWE